ncbi:pheromone A receptor-domain-containing protein [Infundibulicybe gibba]|nr:pheromone A receptor-domain-containing protein [Infundibulicybe gibba]
MPTDFSVVSFVCAALLAIFVPLPCIRNNVANLAIVSWLIVCNITHGVNAVLWAGNTNIHVPVWCDIVTKLLLGVNVALPGACVCLARYLELASSSRVISTHPRVKRNRMLVELVLCYLFPTIYMSLHVIGQDHRFDLVKDLGCSASIHPSTPTLLIICASFSSHISSRSPMSSSLFVRRVAISLIMTGVLTVINLFSVFSISELEQWKSWASVHAQIRLINVVSSQDEIKSIQLVWWGVPVVSIIYIATSLTIGEEIRDMAKWIRDQMTKLRAWKASRPSPALPMQ